MEKRLNSADKILAAVQEMFPERRVGSERFVEIGLVDVNNCSKIEQIKAIDLIKGHFIDKVSVEIIALSGNLRIVRKLAIAAA